MTTSTIQTRHILLLSVSAGAGHVRAAEALRCYAQAHFPQVNVLHIDVMDYVTAGFRRIYVDSYLKLVQRLPTVWGALYKATDRAEPDDVMQRLRRAVERLNTRSLNKVISDFAPDAVICTHFLPAEILMQRISKGDFHAPVWIQVTDFDLHRLWVMPRMAGYFTANEEVAFRLQRHGIPATQTHVSGIPIMPDFSQAPAKAASRAALGLDVQQPVLLLMGGGAGLGGLDEVAASLLALDGDFQLIVLAGRNQSVLAALKELAGQYPGRLFPQGFTDRVEQLMASADLMITKPGGLTSSECLAMGLPMIIHAPIPGQEERNADYLLEQGVALKAIDGAGLAYRVCALMSHPARLDAMRQRAQKLGKPEAAQTVLSTVLGALEQNQ